MLEFKGEEMKKPPATAEEIKKTGEGKVNRLIEGMPHQVAEGLEGYLKEYERKKISKEQLMDKFDTIIRGQVESACDTVDAIKEKYGI